MYKIVDNRTGQIVSVHSTLKQAHRKADRLDLKYGAIRYIVQPMNVKITSEPGKTASDLQAWRTKMGWSKLRAARELGVSDVAYAQWERGFRYGSEGGLAPIPHWVSAMMRELERAVPEPSEPVG